jgi:hypothetical protein
MLRTIEVRMRRTRDAVSGKARPGRRLGSWLAICLLLLQLVVAAGHFHPEDFAFLQGKADGTVAIAATGQDGATLPGGGQPSLPAHDDCPLCFNLHVLGGSALPEPTALAVPSEHVVALPPPTGELALVSAPHLLFQTRAPPAL